MQGGIDTIGSLIQMNLQNLQKAFRSHFFFTRIGCGIAGSKRLKLLRYLPESAKLPNVYLPFGFWKVINQIKKTFISHKLIRGGNSIKCFLASDFFTR